MKKNAKAPDYRLDKGVRLAGGQGMTAAKQSPEELLRRSVMANLLWEDTFYEDGISVTENIMKLVPKVDPAVVFDMAVEARTKQKLRHVPLFIAREMSRINTHKGFVGHLLPKIILRADELAEFVSLYWLGGKQPLSKQVKIGLAKAFHNFDTYHFAKYNRNNEIKIRDVMFMVHPTPPQGKEELYKQIAEDTLPVPDTWEVALSTGKNKKESWTRLINENKLGALAFVRNLRNMESAGVSKDIILKGFESINPRWLVPLNYLAAAKAAPRYERELETLMLKGLSQAPKLPGHTIFVVDVSGSMGGSISSRSEFDRLDAASAMAMLAAEMCEHISIYSTAGNDGSGVHATELIKPRRGFSLPEEIRKSKNRVGGGGIFTRQCLEYIQSKENTTPDRIIIFSDSQDCDRKNKVPKPFGKNNYIVDVSAHSRGIKYDGVWSAEISGWSEHFLSFIAAHEGVVLTEQDTQE